MLLPKYLLDVFLTVKIEIPGELIRLMIEYINLKYLIFEKEDEENDHKEDILCCVNLLNPLKMKNITKPIVFQNEIHANSILYFHKFDYQSQIAIFMKKTKIKVNSNDKLCSCHCGE